MRCDVNLVILGGCVIDGTGAEPFDANVVASSSRITGIGRVYGSGARRSTPGHVSSCRASSHAHDGKVYEP